MAKYSYSLYEGGSAPARLRFTKKARKYIPRRGDFIIVLGTKREVVSVEWDLDGQFVDVFVVRKD